MKEPQLIEKVKKYIRMYNTLTDSNRYPLLRLLRKYRKGEILKKELEYYFYSLTK